MCRKGRFSQRRSQILIIGTRYNICSAWILDTRISTCVLINHIALIHKAKFQIIHNDDIPHHNWMTVWGYGNLIANKKLNS